MVYSVGVGPWGILFILMIVTFLLGFFFDWIEITLIVLPVFAPILAGLDFGDHVPKLEVVYWFSILMAVNLQTSFLTPPFGFALFYMKGVAPPEVRIQQIYRGDHPIRDPAADRPRAGHCLPRDRHVAAAHDARLRHA